LGFVKRFSPGGEKSGPPAAKGLFWGPGGAFEGPEARLFGSSLHKLYNFYTEPCFPGCFIWNTIECG
jgi:hypothetical protein